MKRRSIPLDHRGLKDRSDVVDRLGMVICCNVCNILIRECYLRSSSLWICKQWIKWLLCVIPWFMSIYDFWSSRWRTAGGFTLSLLLFTFNYYHLEDLQLLFPVGLLISCDCVTSVVILIQWLWFLEIYRYFIDILFWF